MKYIDNWDKVKARYEECWALENHDRPLLDIRTRKDNAKEREITHPATQYERWTDADYIVRRTRAGLETTYFAGEAYPCVNPNLGPDIFGASFGAEMIFELGTSYSVPFIEDWDAAGELKVDPDNKWWKKIKEITNTERLKYY